MNYKEFFNKAKEKGLTNIQITEKETINSEAGVLDGELEDFNISNDTEYHIKAEYNNKTVKLFTNYLGQDIIDLIIFKSNSTDSKYDDEYLTKTDSIKKNNPVNIDISDKVKILKELDTLRKENKKIDKLSTYYTEEWKNTRIINSNGVDISTDIHFSMFGVSAISHNKLGPITFDRNILEIGRKEIDFEGVTKDVIDKTIIQAKREKLINKKYDVIIDNSIAGKIISHLIGMLSSSNVRVKVSCLGDKLDKKVFNDKLTIVEEPMNRKYPGYRLFDDEGTKTIDKTIIDKGKIKTFFYNIQEAKIKNTKSTGNGYGEISTRNMYVKPGKKSFEELLKDLDNGIYITDYMGSQGSAINHTNGQISIQVFGFIVKNGKIEKGFVPAIMTTTIFELLSNIKEIGNDLVFTNTSSASPSLYIKDISIAS